MTLQYKGIHITKLPHGEEIGDNLREGETQGEYSYQDFEQNDTGNDIYIYMSIGPPQK